MPVSENISIASSLHVTDIMKDNDVVSDTAPNDKENVFDNLLGRKRSFDEGDSYGDLQDNVTIDTDVTESVPKADFISTITVPFPTSIVESSISTSSLSSATVPTSASTISHASEQQIDSTYSDSPSEIPLTAVTSVIPPTALTAITISTGSKKETIIPVEASDTTSSTVRLFLPEETFLEDSDVSSSDAVNIGSSSSKNSNCSETISISNHCEKFVVKGIKDNAAYIKKVFIITIKMKNIYIHRLFATMKFNMNGEQ